MTSALPMLAVVAMVVMAHAQDAPMPDIAPPPPVEVTTTTEPKVYASTYWFTFPRKVRPGLPLTVRGQILKATQPVTVNFALVNVTSFQPIISFPPQVFQPNVPQTVQLQIPADLPDPQWQGFRLNVTASGGLKFEDSKEVYFERKARSIFVQTDKAMYKPGDTVNFRVLVMTPDLKVAKMPMDILIFDPNNNRIAQWLGVQDPSGVYQGNLTTASEPVLGEWSIKVTVQGQEEDQKFTIAEYVLPKFEVKFDLPPFGVSSAPLFSGKVKVKYTFGKPVEGSARVAMQVKYYYNKWRGEPAPEVVKLVQVVGGEAQFTFTRDEILQLALDSSYDSKRNISEVSLNYNSFIVIANVTETITGKKMGAEAEVIFHDNPYNLEFVGQSNVFKPGMVFRAMLKITKRDGSALESTVGVKVNVTMTYDVRRPTTTAPPTTTTTTTPSTPTMVLDPRNATETRLPIIEFPTEDIAIGRFPYYWPQYDTVQLSTQLHDFTQDGFVPLTMEVPAEAERININAEALDTNAYLYASRSYSPSDNYIQMSMPADRPRPKVGETAVFSVRGTEDIRTLTYEVISKGRLVASQTLQFAPPSRTAEVSVPVQGDMAPSSQVVVYYRREDGEIVADSNSVSFDGLFDNPVTLSFDKATVKPGERVQLRVRTQEPNSLVQLLGVDKSVKLLASGNDITEDRVLRDLMSYDYGYGCFHCDFMFARWWWPMPSSGSDAASIFDSADLCVLTDANLYRHQQPNYYGGPMFMARGEMANADLSAQSAPVPAMGSGGAMQGPERVRTEFPEKWLWDSVITDGAGQATVDLTAPDTITSWVTTAFAVHDTKGLSVATEAAEVTTFLPLFVRPELPYSCIRGEILCIQATAFNYEPRALPVLLSLARSEEYYNVFMRPQPFTNQLQEQSYFTLLRYYLGFMSPDTTRSAHFCIRPRKLGHIKLNFTLMSWIPGDGVSRTLLVEPEGVPRSENTAVLADLRSSPTRNFRQEITFTTPANAVNGSVSVRVSIAGDVLGPTLNNIGGLVKMPYGCGEQNMVNFAPNIYVYGYLQKTNRLDDKTKETILDYMRQGYMRELKYQHGDGSYSAFGDQSSWHGSNNNGSMWLTAFVTKCFVQASGLIDIDAKVVNRALAWMALHQAPNGSFIEPGRVFNKRLQGGSGSGEALTAYVLITLAEALPWATDNMDGKEKEMLRRAVLNARQYLELQLPGVTDPYDLAILTFALGRSNSTQLRAARSQLESTAIIADGTKHYERRDQAERPPAYSWYDPTDALAVEATAYALCDAASQNDVTLGLGMMRWISNHRNPNGGFISTQDTVIALQCLAQFAEQVYSDVFNMAVTVSWAGDSKTFQVNRDTSLLLQTQELRGAATPGTPQTVRVDASGTGLAVVDVARYYHVVQEAVDQSFRLDVTLERETTDYFLLRACTAYQLGGNSSMAVMEIGIPSGFAAELEDPGTALPGVTRRETQDRKLILYFDEIPQQPLCVMVPMAMYSKVAKGQSNVVKVYDYYQPKDATTKLYSKTEAGVCEVCPECGACQFWGR